MEQVSGEVHQKEEGLKTLERVDQKLSTKAFVSEQDTQSNTKQAMPKEKDNLLNAKFDTKLVSFLYLWSTCGHLKTDAKNAQIKQRIHFPTLRNIARSVAGGRSNTKKVLPL